MTATCDTSVLVPALLPQHEAHAASRAAVGAVDAVPAHVLTEAYSVLTRLPPAHRIPPAVAARALAQLPWSALDFRGDVRPLLIERASSALVSGGAVYDALVGLTAAQHGLVLLTRDRRARRTYDAFDIAYRVV